MRPDHPAARRAPRLAARPLTLLLALAALAAPPPAAAQEAHARHASHGTATRPADTAVRLLPGLGRHARRVATRSANAQRFFDQGLSLAYAFNHGEALRSFQEAVRLDSTCAMCHWGIAYVLGPNINAPMEPSTLPSARQAIARAQGLAASAGPTERALISALATRYASSGDGAPAERASLDSAYAIAMAEVARRFPSDADVLTLHAESMMLLSPWAYWTRDHEPRPGTTALLASLERAMRVNRNHPGACHFYIHAVEAAFPERAVDCAERLAALMPGAGHIVHMPGHIYLRVGRYDDAIAANRHAVHADEAFMADAPARGGSYGIAYYPHNHHFLAFAATLAGHGDVALESARQAAVHTPAEVAAGVPELQLLVAFPHLTLATFSRWDEVLREPMPSSILDVATALATWSRGMAWSARGAVDSASTALAIVRKAAESGMRPPIGPVLQVAQRTLEAELVAMRGDTTRALALLEEAADIEDAMSYMEPPYWHQPVRHRLGALLAASGRADEATRRYREDLARFPKNVWSTRGLAAVRAAHRQ
jgi:tetratricopeptide (TPR) repeat protein